MPPKKETYWVLSRLRLGANDLLLININGKAGIRTLYLNAKSCMTFFTRHWLFCFKKAKMIEVKNLSKKYGEKFAVENLSFKVETGQTIALIGTSGSGKTTTLKMINRLVEPTEGAILVDGDSVLDQPIEQIRRRMGYVIQHIGLFPHYTIAENIAVVPQLLNWEAKRTRDRSYRLMERMGLPPEQYAQKYPHELSGGQQQRVGIARALAGDPPIILMDEPFGALDPITRRSIRKEFMQLEELKEKTTIIVTHDVDEAFEMGDWVCLLHEGKLQQLGTPRQLLFEPANTFVSEFIAGQQLQLELETVCLRDVFSYLPQRPTHNSSEVELNGAESILAAMTKLNQAAKQNKSGALTLGEERKTLDLPGLMEAYFEFSTQQ